MEGSWVKELERGLRGGSAIFNLQNAFDQASHTGCALQMADAAHDRQYHLLLVALGPSRNSADTHHLDKISHQRPSPMTLYERDVTKQDSSLLQDFAVQYPL